MSRSAEFVGENQAILHNIINQSESLLTGSTVGHVILDFDTKQHYLMQGPSIETLVQDYINDPHADIPPTQEELEKIISETHDAMKRDAVTKIMPVVEVIAYRRFEKAGKLSPEFAEEFTRQFSRFPEQLTTAHWKHFIARGEDGDWALIEKVTIHCKDEDGPYEQYSVGVHSEGVKDRLIILADEQEIIAAEFVTELDDKELIDALSALEDVELIQSLGWLIHQVYKSQSDIDAAVEVCKKYAAETSNKKLAGTIPTIQRILQEKMASHALEKVLDTDNFPTQEQLQNMDELLEAMNNAFGTDIQ